MKLFGFLRKKRCVICDRVLKSKKSKECGMGPVCAKKNATLAYQSLLEKQGQMRLELGEKNADDVATAKP